MMKFIWKHFCGDATSDYDVSLSEPCTIGQLIEQVLLRSEQHREYGDIWIVSSEVGGDVYLCSYKDGNFDKPLWWIKDYSETILDKYKDIYVEKVSANGDYGGMSYYIHIAQSKNN